MSNSSQTEISYQGFFPKINFSKVRGCLHSNPFPARSKSSSREPLQVRASRVASLYNAGQIHSGCVVKRRPSTQPRFSCNTRHSTRTCDPSWSSQLICLCLQHSPNRTGEPVTLVSFGTSGTEHRDNNAHQHSTVQQGQQGQIQGPQVVGKVPVAWVSKNRQGTEGLGPSLLGQLHCELQIPASCGPHSVYFSGHCVDL